MERIKSLERYPKIILLLIIVMALVFMPIYSITINREGFAYKDTILVPQQENGTTIYSDKIKGEQAVFTVSEDKTVEFKHGDKVYGPYTAKEDATAVPKDDNTLEGATGVELRCGDDVIFRGGVQRIEGFLWLENEDGSYANGSVHAVTSDGTIIDGNGNAVDPMEPSVAEILELMAGPQLTHKGTWLGWFCGAIVCFIAMLSIIFADELFYLRFAFRVRNAEDVEPSEWEITSRYVAWTVLLVFVLIIFIMGLANVDQSSNTDKPSNTDKTPGTVQSSEQDTSSESSEVIVLTDCVIEVDRKTYVVLPISKERIRLTYEELSYIDIIEYELLKAAEEKISAEIAQYPDADNSGFHLQVLDGYLNLSVELIVDIDDPLSTEEDQGCGDHVHKYFNGQISSVKVESESEN